MLVVGAEWFDDRPGGLMRYVKDYVPAMTEEGIDVTAIVLGPALSAPAAYRAVARADAPLWRRVWSVLRAAHGLGQVEVLDVHFALYGALPMALARFRHTPCIVHFQGPWSAESRASGDRAGVVRAKHLVEQLVYRRARALIVLSDAFRDVLVSDYGVEARRIHVIRPGTDLSRFAPGDRETRRLTVGAGYGTFVAVCARRLERRMGIDVLLGAWGLVQEKVPDSLLLVVGDGSDRDALAALAARLPRPSGIRFLGVVDDAELVSLYEAADCSVVPSRSLEGFGLVVLESLACGTPPIVTDAAGLPESVRDLDDSLVVPAGDESALATRLIAAARGELPARSACRVHAERFSWTAVARRHVEVLDAVATKRSSTSSRRLRVAFVDHCAALSGGELALARLLGALDVEAHVILAEDGPLRRLLELSGATVHVLPLADRVRGLSRHKVGLSAAREALDTGSYIVRLTRLLRRLDPDIVHTNSLKAALYGGVAGRLARVPVVWHIRDRIALDYMPSPAVRLVRSAARVLPTAVIANSSTTLGTLGRLRVRSTTIPSPIIVAVRESTIDRACLRVGMVGRLAPWKGQDLFLRAFGRAFGGGTEEAVIVGAAMFGEAAFEVELRALVSTLGLDGRVEFRGFCEDIDAEFANMDVVVHASMLPEPFGQVVVEAMAAGVPVVVADQGGPAEIVDDGVTGLMYPMGDEIALAAVLALVAVDPRLRRRLSRAALEVVERYRPKEVAAEVLSFYESVVST